MSADWGPSRQAIRQAGGPRAKGARMWRPRPGERSEAFPYQFAGRVGHGVELFAGANARLPGRQDRSTERSLRSVRRFTTWSPMIRTGTLARAASLVATLPSRTLDIPAPLAPTTSKP
jgi:hypothetical protein